MYLLARCYIDLVQAAAASGGGGGTRGHWDAAARRYRVGGRGGDGDGGAGGAVREAGQRAK